MSKYYIVSDQAGVIWGSGNSYREALVDAKFTLKNYDGPDKKSVDLNLPQRCTKRLFEEVAENGWSDSLVWHSVNGVAMLLEEIEEIFASSLGQWFEIQGDTWKLPEN